MPAISLVEFIVYGFFTYSSMLMLIISTVKDIPKRKTLTIARSMYMIPGLICALILASSGVDVVVLSTDTTTRNVNTTEVWTESTEQVMVLQNPVWITVHYMIFAVLVVYVIFQALTLLTKHDEKDSE